VTQICRQLDGIPLAIELAAARLRGLSIEHLAERLDQRFRLLTGGNRAALPRQQTLHATVEWSYDLLSAPERTLFTRLSVFAGGFDLDAAEAIGAGGPLARDEVLDLLLRLVDRSLVTVEESAGNVARYRLLETMRQYGHERLEDEVADVRTRHAAHYLALAEEAEPALTGPEQGAWLGRLEAEHDNLRAALGWARASGDGERGLRLAGALHRFWSTRGYLTEGRGWLEALLAGDGPASDAVRATALHGAGGMAFAQGDYPHAAALYEAGLALHRESGDRRGIAICLNGLGVVTYRMGDLARAGMLYEESLAIFRALGDTPRVAVLLLNLGWIAGERDDDEQAVALLQESLALRRRLGDQQGTAFALHGLAMVAYRGGDLAQASALQAEALALRRALGDRPGIAYTLPILGLIAYRQGDLERAGALYEESLALQRDVGDRGGIVFALNGLGLVVARQGAHARARTLFEESLRLSRDIGARGKMAEALEGLMWIGAMRGQPEWAARLGGSAEALRETLGIPLEPEQLDGHDQAVQAMRAALGDVALAGAWAAGRALAPEQAVAEALAGGPGG
jgi:non-specific serine/threonine protein kinase